MKKLVFILVCLMSIATVSASECKVVLKQNLEDPVDGYLTQIEIDELEEYSSDQLKAKKGIELVSESEADFIIEITARPLLDIIVPYPFDIERLWIKSFMAIRDARDNKRLFLSEHAGGKNIEVFSTGTGFGWSKKSYKKGIKKNLNEFKNCKELLKKTSSGPVSMG